MAEGEEVPLSRLDSLIRRRELLNTKANQLGDDFSVAVQNTANKLNTHFQ